MPFDFHPISAEDLLQVKALLRAHPVVVVLPSPPNHLYLLDTQPDTDKICARFGFIPAMERAIAGYLVRIAGGRTSHPPDVVHYIEISPTATEFRVRHLWPGEYHATMQSWVDLPDGRLFSVPSPSLVFRLAEPSLMTGLAAQLEQADQLGTVFTLAWAAEMLSLPETHPRTVAMDGRQDRLISADYPYVHSEPIRITGTLTPYGREVITLLDEATRPLQQPVPVGGGWWCYVCQAFTKVSESMADGDVDALCFTCGERNTRRRNG